MRCIRKDNEDVVTKFVKSVIAGDMEQALTLMRAYHLPGWPNASYLLMRQRWLWAGIRPATARRRQESLDLPSMGRKG